MVWLLRKRTLQGRSSTEDINLTRHKDLLSQIIKADKEEIEQGTDLSSQSDTAYEIEKIRKAFRFKYTLLKQHKYGIRSLPVETVKPPIRPLENSYETYVNEESDDFDEFQNLYNAYDFTKISEAYEHYDFVQ